MGDIRVQSTYSAQAHLPAKVEKNTGCCLWDLVSKVFVCIGKLFESIFSCCVPAKTTSSKSYTPTPPSFSPPSSPLHSSSFTSTYDPYSRDPLADRLDQMFSGPGFFPNHSARGPGLFGDSPFTTRPSFNPFFRTDAFPQDSSDSGSDVSDVSDDDDFAGLFGSSNRHTSGSSFTRTTHYSTTFPFAGASLFSTTPRYNPREQSNQFYWEKDPTIKAVFNQMLPALPSEIPRVIAMIRANQESKQRVEAGLAADPRTEALLRLMQQGNPIGAGLFAIMILQIASQTLPLDDDNKAADLENAMNPVLLLNEKGVKTHNQGKPKSQHITSIFTATKPEYNAFAHRVVTANTMVKPELENRIPKANQLARILLGFEPNADISKDTVKKAYTNIAVKQRVHPDKHNNAESDVQALVTALFQVLTQARDILDKEIENGS